MFVSYESYPIRKIALTGDVNFQHSKQPSILVKLVSRLLSSQSKLLYFNPTHADMLVLILVMAEISLSTCLLTPFTYFLPAHCCRL